MRKRFEGLAGLVRAQLGEEPLSGHLFVFSNAARTRVKILFWDESGLWVCGKRLERGRFCWLTLEQGNVCNDVQARPRDLASASCSKYTQSTISAVGE